MAEINGSSFVEVDDSDWADCEGGHKIPPWTPCKYCGQRHPPGATRTFRATHKAVTPGHPDRFFLRAPDCIKATEQDWRDRGERSHLYLYDLSSNDWLYWRSVPA